MQAPDVALICKALGDVNRLKILEMLTDGEKCACKLLDAFAITQPTLSHHMKILRACDLVAARKDGRWMHYRLNNKTLNALGNYVSALTATKDE